MKLTVGDSGWTKCTVLLDGRVLHNCVSASEEDGWTVCNAVPDDFSESTRREMSAYGWDFGGTFVMKDGAIVRIVKRGKVEVRIPGENDA